jgi:O-antigen/teichoic acid export membrane protein
MSIKNGSIFHYLKGLFKGNEINQNAIIVIAGSIAAQIIPLIFSPVLSRIYSPEQFGLFSTISVSSGMLGIAACLRYEHAIILPENNLIAEKIASGAIRISLIIAVALFLILLFFSDVLASKLNFHSNHRYLLTIPMIFFCMGIFQTGTYWLIRKKAFKRNAFAKIVQTLSITFISLIAGFFFRQTGLIIGFTGGWMILSAFTAYQIKKEKLNIFSQQADAIVSALKRYREFPILNLLPALMNAIASSLPVFFISSYYNQEITGLYNQTRMVVLAPISLITLSLSQIYLEHIAVKVRNKETIQPTLKSIISKLLLISGILFILSLTLAPMLFEWVFGKTWRMSGVFLQILIFSYAIQFVVSPLSNILIALNRIKLASIWPVIYLSLMLSLSFFKYLEIKNFLILLTIAEVIAYAIYLLFVVYAVRSYQNNLKQLT